MPDCNKCIWSTRSGGCVSWECKFVSHEDARKMIEKEQRKVRTLNHDYAHCSDYEENNARCPKSCFRAELTRDLLLNPQPISSWMHFAGTSECPLKSFSTYREDGRWNDD